MLLYSQFCCTLCRCGVLHPPQHAVQSVSKTSHDAVLKTPTGAFAGTEECMRQGTCSALWCVQSGGQRHYTGTIDAWGKIYREEGGKAFFKVRSRQGSALCIAGYRSLHRSLSFPP